MATRSTLPHRQVPVVVRDLGDFLASGQAEEMVLGEGEHLREAPHHEFLEPRLGQHLGLGVVCYELLSGRLPHDLRDKTITVAIRIISEESPDKLEQAGSAFPVDLETIVAKALAPDRSRRYASASELAADVRRFLDDQPIAARLPSPAYHLRKLVARHKLAFALSASLVVLLIAYAP